MNNITDSKYVFAIRTKSNIKDPQILLDTAKTIGLTKINRVLISKNNPELIGKLRSLRGKVQYFYVDPELQKEDYEKIKAYLMKKDLKVPEDKKPLVFGVNSPYKQKVKEKSLSNYISTYLYRSKIGSKTIKKD